jgi:hypothetical protein
MLKIKELCGVKRVSTNTIKCTAYQMLIIESYLSEPKNKFKSGKDFEIFIQKIEDTEFTSLNFKASNNSKSNNIEYMETFSKLNNKDTKFNSSNIHSHFESQHKLNFDSHGQLDLILIENNLTNVEADCILCPINVGSSNSISETIKTKAGHVYVTELKSKIDEYVKSKNKSKVHFALLYCSFFNSRSFVF